MPRTLIIALCSSLFFCAAPYLPPLCAGQQTGSDYVVLLHGLGRTRRSMLPLEKHLLLQGYRTVNIGYPSRQEPIQDLARSIRTEIVRQCPDDSARIHFV
ncbi:esterase/lipase family protein, partial [Thermodesulfobacteriota bacterium]